MMEEERKKPSKTGIGKNGRAVFSAADNPKPFTSEYQPPGAGRKKTAHITNIMRSLGHGLAPRDIREDATVREFLDQHGMRGTVNEVLIARLYSLAIYKGDTRAFQLIFELLQGKIAKKNNINIQFVMPPSDEQPIELGSDQWSIAPPTPDS